MQEQEMRTTTIAGVDVKVLRQGRAIVERDASADGGFWIMLPTGDMRHADTKALALQMIQRWAGQQVARARAGAGVLTIEWKDCE